MYEFLELLLQPGGLIATVIVAIIVTHVLRLILNWAGQQDETKVLVVIELLLVVVTAYLVLKNFTGAEAKGDPPDFVLLAVFIVSVFGSGIAYLMYLAIRKFL